jgi:hypothetical protein
MKQDTLARAKKKANNKKFAKGLPTFMHSQIIPSQAIAVNEFGA